MRARTITALWALGLLAGCSGGPVKELSVALGVDLSAGAVVRQTDTHGGFHGDGETYLELTFDETAGAALEGELAQSEHWRSLPMGGTLKSTLAGNEQSKAMTGTETGYWYFRDRHSGSTDPDDDSGLEGRGSYNFDAAVYDAQARTLYYYVLDT